ncbi:MAG: ribose 5-phosphate isomerase B [Alphaproteobacteria bacterium]|nr:ribose 5-phosphate isomerase B [Rhodospirillaceae bacterium]MBT7614122.1 ribose 5-phosphate isomerase B [Rhodospirillaceae bacterium]MBT7648159.1 ribose 5-phosphate isomerase B [Rhodospirillaceae bacterium]MDG2483086.1 ribose 5-phosphate isomerase B [Alphaproteobacteria bacterium]
MTSIKLAMASDHAGLTLKTILADTLESWGHEVVDLGTHDEESVDYPDFADLLANCLASGEVEWGVLICGTGIGISIAANRHPHVRAAVCHDVTSARLTRLHNNANVLALGERVIGTETAKDCLKVFIETSFEGGRHQRRVDKLSPQ